MNGVLIQRICYFGQTLPIAFIDFTHPTSGQVTSLEIMEESRFWRAKPFSSFKPKESKEVQGLIMSKEKKKKIEFWVLREGRSTV